MALTIAAIQRANPAPCDHYRWTLDLDGVSRTFSVAREDVRDGRIADLPWQAQLVLLWARYKILGGAALPSLVGQTVVS